jgi:hypothetical protein
MSTEKQHVTAVDPDLNGSATRKVIQYLVDIVEALNCPVDDLINKCPVFKSNEELVGFVERGNNFSILTSKEDLTRRLFFIPVNKIN